MVNINTSNGIKKKHALPIKQKWPRDAIIFVREYRGLFKSHYWQHIEKLLINHELKLMKKHYKKI